MTLRDVLNLAVVCFMTWRIVPIATAATGTGDVASPASETESPRLRALAAALGPTILDNMIAAHAIPPVVAVFLESPNRDAEFPPNDSFQQFVGTDLLPLLRKHYRLSRDP